MKSIAATFCVIAAAGAIGCATTSSSGSSSPSTPQEIVDARSTFARVSHGPAAQLDAPDLEASRQSLLRAEQDFRADGDSYAARDLALRSQRQAELAEARALTKQIRAYEAENGIPQPQPQARLTSSEVPTGAGHAPLHVAEASAALDKFAWVSSEPRGMVIRVPADMLFQTGQSDLTPAGQHKLNKVARAIRHEGNETQVAVEAHTDTQEGAVVGGELSQHRAEAIRDYLSREGILPEHVSTQGFGASRPISDNETADGRARNRRVEIVVRSR